MKEIIQGTVKRIIYDSGRGEYTVFLCEDVNEDEHIIVSYSHPPKMGDELEIEGTYTTHKKYGLQFVATYFEKVKPSSLEGAIKFIQSFQIAGLGPKTLERIVAYFGEDLVQVINDEPEKIFEIDQVRKGIKQSLYDAILGLGALQEIEAFLKEHGISTRFGREFLQIYGKNSVDFIGNNPYKLINSVYGYTFEIADNLASKLGFEENDSRRLKAAILEVLDRSVHDGNTCLPVDELIGNVFSLIQGYVDEIADTVEVLIMDGEIFYYEYDGLGYIYSYPLYEAEENCALRIKESIAKYSPAVPIDIEDFLENFSVINNLELAIEQKEAITQAICNKFFIITGGPGTGKTTIIKALVKAFQKCLLSEIILCAPTGRAAKRLTEATDYEASTIHHLLKPVGDSGYEFIKNEEELLRADVVIVDEASMLNLQLFDALLKAIPESAHIVLVGDVNQLPPIGAGFVLKDLIESGIVPSQQLVEIYRQKSGNMIISNAEKINKGEMPDLYGDDDFTFIRVKNKDDLFRAIGDQYTRALDEIGDELDVQIISPMRRRDYGSYNLSNVIQGFRKENIKNDIHIKVNGQVLTVGDKVIQNVNNYDLGVYNGEVGIITFIAENKVLVKFVDKEIEYSYEDLEGLTLAYVITVHKSQGSEYGIVIISFIRAYGQMLQRNLLYTAVTRARKKVIIVGTEEAIEKAVNTVERVKKYTLFVERLKEII